VQIDLGSRQDMCASVLLVLSPELYEAALFYDKQLFNCSKGSQGLSELVSAHETECQSKLVVTLLIHPAAQKDKLGPVLSCYLTTT
jgi:hypothetical protein